MACFTVPLATAVAATTVKTALPETAKRNPFVEKLGWLGKMMFWGTALMWSVDCVANAMDGEPLLDLSLEDFVLGLIIWACDCSMGAAGDMLASALLELCPIATPQSPN